MKHLLLLLLLLLFASPAMAIDISLAWDNPSGQTWDNVRIYEKNGTVYTLKATVPGSQLTATLTGYNPGSYTFIARSLVGALESVDSNTASKDLNPASPSNFRIAVLEVEVGDDGTVTIKSVKMIPINPNFFRAG